MHYTYTTHSDEEFGCELGAANQSEVGDIEMLVQKMRKATPFYINKTRLHLCDNRHLQPLTQAVYRAVSLPKVDALLMDILLKN